MRTNSPFLWEQSLLRPCRQSPQLLGKSGSRQDRVWALALGLVISFPETLTVSSRWTRGVSAEKENAKMTMGIHSLIAAIREGANSILFICAPQTTRSSEMDQRFRSAHDCRNTVGVSGLAALQKTNLIPTSIRSTQNQELGQASSRDEVLGSASFLSDAFLYGSVHAQAVLDLASRSEWPTFRLAMVLHVYSVSHGTTETWQLICVNGCRHCRTGLKTKNGCDIPLVSLPPPPPPARSLGPCSRGKPQVSHLQRRLSLSKPDGQPASQHGEHRGKPKPRGEQQTCI